VQDCERNRTKIVVGLGNPGRRYARTRHNVGFEVIESLRGRWGLDAGRHAFSGVVIEWRAGTDEAPRRVMLFKPHTYMNLSGRAAADIARFYKADPQEVLVVLDDLALPLGQLRARAGGSAGGHNGLSDVLAALGTEQVPRLRIGIGPRPEQIDAMSFVLQRFTPDEQAVVDEALQLGARAVEDWVRDGIACVMNRYNRKVQEDEPPDVETCP